MPAEVEAGRHGREWIEPAMAAFNSQFASESPPTSPTLEPPSTIPAVMRDSGGRVLRGSRLRASAAQKRRKSAGRITEWMTRIRLQSLLSSLFTIATNPANRQAVAAANALLDRCVGPVAQQIVMDVTEGESQAEKRERLLALVAEMAVREAIEAPSEAAPGGDSAT